MAKKIERKKHLLLLRRSNEIFCKEIENINFQEGLLKTWDLKVLYKDSKFPFCYEETHTQNKVWCKWLNLFFNNNNNNNNNYYYYSKLRTCISRWNNIWMIIIWSEMQQNKLNKSYKLIFTSQLTLQKANEEYLNEIKDM